MKIVRVPGCRIPLLSSRWGAAAVCGDDLHLLPAQTRDCIIPNAKRFRNTPFYPLFLFLNPVSRETILRVAGRG